MPKNNLDLVFRIYKGGHPKSLNLNSSKLGDFVQGFGTQLSIFLLAEFKTKNLLPLLTLALVKIMFGHKIYIFI